MNTEQLNQTMKSIAPYFAECIAEGMSEDEALIQAFSRQRATLEKLNSKEGRAYFFARCLKVMA